MSKGTLYGPSDNLASPGAAPWLLNCAARFYPVGGVRRRARFNYRRALAGSEVFKNLTPCIGTVSKRKRDEIVSLKRLAPYVSEAYRAHMFLKLKEIGPICF